MRDAPDFSSYCAAACIAFWGEPDHKNHKELRWGARDGYGGRSCNLKKRCWYDADAKIGGSTLELIAYERGWHDGDGKPNVRGKRFFEAWRIAHEKNIVPEPPPGPRAPIDAPIRAVFAYHDENGVHLYDVVRFDTENKNDRFRYRQPDGTTWKLGKTRRALYRLPALIAAIKAGALVLFTEGEKDCETAVRLGYAATCHCGGVVDGWRKAYAQQLAAADVVIVADTDAPGQKYAAEIAPQIGKVAKRVRCISPPQSAKDLSAWIAGGGSKEQLEALIAAAPDLTESADPAPEPLDDEAEFERLARLNLMQYERARVAAAKALGIRPGTLDRLVTIKREELGLDEGEDDDRPGRPVQLPEIEPWPQPVGDGEALLDALAAAIGGTKDLPGYMVLSADGRDGAALWAVHTFCIGFTQYSPRLVVRSPDMRCGKTRLIEILERLTWRPKRSDNTTMSAMFRLIDRHQPTVLLDEVDGFLSKHDQDGSFRSLINSGYRKGTVITRNVRGPGDDFEPRDFGAFAPMALAGIGSHQAATVLDRAVIIHLTRRLPHEPIKPFDLNNTSDLDELARKIKRWVDDHAEDLRATAPTLPAGLFNRTADVWGLLIRIAEVAGERWAERARALALAAAQIADTDQTSQLVLLLGDLRAIFGEREEMFTTDLIKALIEIEPRPWARFHRNGNAISPSGLARLLGDLKDPKVLSGNVRIGDEQAKGYRCKDLQPHFDRLLPPFQPSHRTYVGATGTSSTLQPSQDYSVGTAAKWQKPAPRGPWDGGTAENTPTSTKNASDDPHARGAISLSARQIREMAQWLSAFSARHIGDDDLIAEAVRERLRNRYDVRPEDLDIEAARVMDRALMPLETEEQHDGPR
jgi:hypothetical protein